MLQKASAMEQERKNTVWLRFKQKMVWLILISNFFQLCGLVCLPNIPWSITLVNKIGQGFAHVLSSVRDPLLLALVFNMVVFPEVLFFFGCFLVI